MLAEVVNQFHRVGNIAVVDGLPSPLCNAVHFLRLACDASYTLIVRSRPVADQGNEWLHGLVVDSMLDNFGTCSDTC